MPRNLTYGTGDSPEVPTTWEFSPHALARALDMAVEPDELRDCLNNPECIRWSVRHESWHVECGRITIGYRTRGHVGIVVTVLWRTAEDWEADYQYPSAPGREPRHENASRKALRK